MDCDQSFLRRVLLTYTVTTTRRLQCLKSQNELTLLTFSYTNINFPLKDTFDLFLTLQSNFIPKGFGHVSIQTAWN